ncbi:hypothetical protein BDR05DRAFT_1030475 [Suillus weaverae]|nr:hypothetical protein BDR05DRAFT_1030475 [Suillus weaverae]
MVTNQFVSRNSPCGLRRYHSYQKTSESQHPCIIITYFRVIGIFVVSNLFDIVCLK